MRNFLGLEKKTICVAFFIVIINLIFNSLFDLQIDEIYYWNWSQHLALSYYDGSPLIAYLIRLSTLLGHSEFFVRLPAVITSFAALFFIYLLAKKMFDHAVANVAVLVALACPLIEIYYWIVTYDSPLFLFWIVTLYTLFVALFENKKRYFYWAGLFFGFALLSKYTAILLAPGLLLFLLCSQSHRHWFLRKELYLSGVVAILVFSPVLIWNYQHHFVSFAYQLTNGFGEKKSVGLHWDTFGKFWTDQLLLSGPILFLSIFYYLIRYAKTNMSNPRLLFLLSQFITGLIFFAICSFIKQDNGNWPAPIYLSGSIFLAWWIVKKNQRWIYRVSLCLIFICLLVIKLPLLFLPASMHNAPNIRDFFGHKILFNAIKPYFTNDLPIIGCNQTAVAYTSYYLHPKQIYYLPGHPAYKALSSKMIFPDNLKVAQYICDGDNQGALDVIRTRFTHIQLLHESVFHNKLTDKQLYLYRVKK